MGLPEEIEGKRQEIRTDEYAMSIGEWVSLYENEEIDIHPEFQRFFRWSEEQKTNLIESLLLGIPIPPIFVSQRRDGVWDVVDGLQRLSTIYQFLGVLKDENGDRIQPIVLGKTKHLPSLEGYTWASDENDKNFDTATKLLIKRSKINVSIVLRESDPNAKYELFQRLNTGGSSLSEQEVRNCILVMLNRDLYDNLKNLCGLNSYQECLSISEQSLSQQYDMDLLTRFILFYNSDIGYFSNMRDLNIFLTDEISNLAQRADYRIDEAARVFTETFNLLFEATGGGCLKKYSREKDAFFGGFIVSAFEVVALGIGYNIAQGNRPTDILNKIKSVYDDPIYIQRSGSGLRATNRLPYLIPLGRQIFSS